MTKQEQVVDAFQQDPTRSYSSLAKQYNMPRSRVRNVLRAAGLYEQRSYSREPIHKELFLCDLHVPYQDEQALNVALDYGKSYQPDIVYLGGDIEDFYAISSWKHDPYRITLSDEVEAVKETLCRIRSTFPKATIYYSSSNHGDRLTSYMYQKSPELSCLRALHPISLYSLDRLDIDYINTLDYWTKNDRPFNLHGLIHLHGHEVRTRSYVYATRRMLQEVMADTIFGHFHYTDTSVRKTAFGTPVGAWSVGCLCRLTVEFAPVNQWNHGFATVAYYGDDDYLVNNYRIIGTRIY